MTDRKRPEEMAAEAFPCTCVIKLRTVERHFDECESRFRPRVVALLAQARAEQRAADAVICDDARVKLEKTEIIHNAAGHEEMAMRYRSQAHGCRVCASDIRANAETEGGEG